MTPKSLIRALNLQSLLRTRLSFLSFLSFFDNTKESHLYKMMALSDVYCRLYFFFSAHICEAAGWPRPATPYIYTSV